MDSIAITMPHDKNTRAITREEIAASHLIARAIKQSPKSQEEIGAEVGVSQGQIWQWANARRGVSSARAVALAGALDIDDPGKISPKWAAAFGGTRTQSKETPNESSATTELYSLTHKASPKSKRLIARLVDADLQGELDAADYEFIERLIERLRGKNNA